MARKVAILVHGLNNTPNVMHSSKEYFETQGYECYNLTLSGHKKFFPSWRLQHDYWRDDIKAAHEQAKNLNPDELIFVGFSLGALSGLHASQFYGLKWDKVVLFSPALALKKRIKFFTPLFRLRYFPIPSFTPYKIMKYWVIPSGYIRSIQLLIKTLKDESITDNLLAVISKNDEVLNWKEVADTVKNYGIKSNVIFVKEKKKKWKDFGHLTAGPKYLHDDFQKVEKALNE